jgi:hypothetical protein
MHSEGPTPVRERNWGRGRCRTAVLPWLHSDGKRILSTLSEAYYLAQNRKYAVQYAQYGTVRFVRSTLRTTLGLTKFQLEWSASALLTYSTPCTRV